MSGVDRLDEIEARANAATEGPWLAEMSYMSDSMIVPVTSPGTDLDDPVVEAYAADAAFIAAARTDVPWLVEQVRKRDAALRAVLALHVEYNDGTGAHATCDHCSNEQDEWWPCPTIRAITDALGGAL